MANLKDVSQSKENKELIKAWQAKVCPELVTAQPQLVFFSMFKILLHFCRTRTFEEKKEKKKIMVKIVATTSLPVARLPATDCNAAACAKMCWIGPIFTNFP